MITVTGQGLIDWAEQGPQADLLRMSLELAVPLWMERRWDWSHEQLTEHACYVWNVRAARQHEALLYRVKAHRTNGEHVPGTAEVFNYFADAVACCALVADGGIDLLGLHFCPRAAEPTAPCGRCAPDGAA